MSDSFYVLLFNTHISIANSKFVLFHTTFCNDRVSEYAISEFPLVCFKTSLWMNIDMHMKHIFIQGGFVLTLAEGKGTSKMGY